MLEKNANTSQVNAREIMSSKPTTIQKDALAIEALEILRTKDISQLPVMEGNKYVGVIHVHDLIREGII
jgi:arabinose-5-phosphate isomerase